MHLPTRQATFSLFVASLVAGLLLVMIFASSPSHAQTPIGTGQSGNGDAATNPLTATKGIANTGATTNMVATKQPQPERTDEAPAAGPSDVVPNADNLTPGLLTPTNPLPPPGVNFSQDNAPLGSWPVTIVLGLIVIGVAWGAYQFLRRPPAAIADGEGVELVKTVAPEDIKPIAPLTNEGADVAKVDGDIESTVVIDTAAADAETVATPIVAAAATAAAAPLTSATQPVAQPLDVADELLPYLETLSRADEQLEYVLDRTYITVGRARTNDIVIDNTFVGWQTVSAYHADLRYQNGQFVVVDKQSDNGTFVNRVRTGSNVLEDGMAITFGKVEFIYRQPKG